MHLLSPQYLKANSRCSVNACLWLYCSDTGSLEAEYRSKRITNLREFPTEIRGAKKRRNEVGKHRQGPRSHPRLTWDPAMSRVAAISGSRIRLPGERKQEKQLADSAKGGEKQGVRHRNRPCPLPGSGVLAARRLGRALNPGRVTLLPDPRARPALRVSATKG